MTQLSVVWLAPAIRALRSLRRRDAERVDEAVLRYASGDKSAAFRLPDDEATTVRLAADGYRVRMIVDIHNGVVWIVMVYRAHW